MHGKDEPVRAKKTPPTMLVQTEEEMRSVRALSFVTELSPVGAHNGHGDCFGVFLSYYGCRQHGSCGKRQESPVQLSRERTTSCTVHDSCTSHKYLSTRTW
jgi:hypothetical protein